MRLFRRYVWTTAVLILPMTVGCALEDPLGLPLGGPPTDKSDPTSAKALDSPVIDGCNPCDVNCDGQVTAFDIEPFIDLLVGPNPQPCNTCTGDVNGDGVIDSFDIEPFINCLLGGGNGNGNTNGGNGNANGGNGNANGGNGNANGGNGNANGGNGNANGGNGNANGGNGNTNGGNGNANGGNGNTNGGNGNANGGNGNANGGNGNANGGNSNTNGGNGNVNGGNGNSNGGNGNSNGDLCIDGSFRVRADLLGGGGANGRMEYRVLVGGCRRFRVRVDDFPTGIFDVTIEGVFVGELMTDGRGRGELEYDSSLGNFPHDFPPVFVGDVGDVGGVASGVLLLDCSDLNGNCNAGNGNANGGNGNANGSNGNMNGGNGNANGGNGNANGGNGNANGGNGNVNGP